MAAVPGNVRHRVLAVLVHYILDLLLHLLHGGVWPQLARYQVVGDGTHRRLNIGRAGEGEVGVVLSLRHQLIGALTPRLLLEHRRVVGDVRETRLIERPVDFLDEALKPIEAHPPPEG